MPLQEHTWQVSLNGSADHATLHSVFMQAPAAIAVLRGPEHRYQLANPLYLRMASRRDIVGQTVAEAMPELVEQGFIRLLDQVYATGEPFHGTEVPVLIAQQDDGGELETLILNFVYQPIRDAAGHVEGIFVIAFDVSENVRARQLIEEARRIAESSAAAENAARRQAEAAARRSEFLARAVERLSQGLHVDTIFQELAERVVPELADAASVRIPGPGGALRVVAAMPAGVLDVDPAAPNAASTALPETHPIHEVLATGKAMVIEDYGAWFEPYASSRAYIARIKELDLRRVAFVPMVAHGKIIGVISAAISGSDRPLDRDQVQLLEALGKHAALAVENARLYEEAEQLRRRAEEASVAKDQFIATVSHELRTPLNAILGWSQILKSGRVDAAMLGKGVDTIQRNARAQAQLIEDLLDVSRIAVGKLKIEPSAVHIPSAIEVALDSARPAAQAKDVRLETEVDPEVGSIVVDPDRFQQVIWNLISNSVKFTAPGGRVHISARRAGSQLVFDVVDTGKGIAPDFLPYVFEKFHQAEQGTRKTGGLGLGLSIVRHIVELHGGTVTAESEGLGKGSRFTVRIPIRASHRPSSRTPVENDNGGAGEGAVTLAPRVLDGVRMLVVDDEQDARELLEAILVEAGASVRTARSVEEAIQLFHAEVPDALVSDIGMPGTDGYALVRYVRSLPRDQGGRVPAVALTAHSRSEDRTRALTAGFTTHIPKPVEPAELVIVLANALGREVQEAPGSGAWAAS